MIIKQAIVKILKEYVILEKLKNDFQIYPTTKEEAAPFVTKHYLQKFPQGIKRIYGIYQNVKTGKKMIGVVIYGNPMNTASKFLAPEIKPNEILELKRLFIDDLGIKNLESYAIGQSLKFLKADEPQTKAVITFADSKQGHTGTIYQATNGIYLGQLNGKHKYLYILHGDKEAIKNLVQSKIQKYPKGNQEI